MSVCEASQSALAHQVPPLPDLRFGRVSGRHRSYFEGDRFSYMEAGRADRPPVLLLHGLTANSMYWRHQYESLSETHRVIGWNAPGYLLSDYLKPETPSAIDYARSLIAFMDALEIEKTFIGASSFGSVVAQTLAVLEPSRAVRMVYSGAVYNERPLSAGEQAEFIREREREIAGGPMSLPASVEGLFGSRAAAASAPIMRGLVPATNARAYMQVSHCLATFSGDVASPSKIVAPTLLIQGAEDRIRPAAANAFAFVRAKPDARLVVLEGIGHLPEVEDPSRVSALMLSFFNGGVTSFADVGHPNACEN